MGCARDCLVLNAHVLLAHLSTDRLVALIALGVPVEFDARGKSRNGSPSPRRNRLRATWHCARARARNARQTAENPKRTHRASNA
eukprot:195038-Lingulodinium_polyedra.AAC.1